VHACTDVAWWTCGLCKLALYTSWSQSHCCLCKIICMHEAQCQSIPHCLDQECANFSTLDDIILQV